MKKLLLLLIITPALLFSCDKIEEANTITFDETLSLDIPVVVTAPTAIAVKSTEEEFSFGATQTASLSDINEISDYLGHLKSIDINSAEVVFTNLGTDEKINKIDLVVSGISQAIVTIENITATDNKRTIDKTKLVPAGTILNSTKSITIRVEGSTNMAPMDFIVNMDFDCHIEAKAI